MILFYCPPVLTFFLTHPHPLSFEKERGDVKMFYTIVPLANRVREGELKGVSELQI